MDQSGSWFVNGGERYEDRVPDRGIRRVAFAIDRARKLAQHLINMNRSSARVFLASTDKFDRRVFYY